MAVHPTPDNVLLRAFPSEAQRQLLAAMEHVELRRGDELVAPHTAPSHVYFPVNGVCSTILGAQAGEPPTEVGLFGREGVSGPSGILGAGATPLKTIVQVDGHALRIGVDHMRGIMASEPRVANVLLLYVHVLIVQLATTATAHAQHSLEARLARWLLMCWDRVDGDNLALTHEFMSVMLGSQRSSVTVTLHVLEGLGAIRAERGSVRVLNRDILADLAGGTYGAAEAEYQRLIAASP